MYEAWLSSFALAREASILGAATGDRINIPGVRTIYAAPDVRKRLEIKDIFRRSKYNGVLHQAWTLTISREFAADAFADLWLDAISDGSASTVDSITTRQHRREREPLTFTADATLPGETITARRFRGITLASVELIVQARRAIIEETTWAVLRNDDLPIADVEPGDTITRPVVTALNATGSLALGAGAWTPAESPTAIFSGQIMAQREISPCQFDEDGLPERFETTGPFELLGRAIISPEFGGLAELSAEAAACRLFWRIGTPTQRIEFEIATGVAKASGGNILHSGDGTVPLDWMARTDGLGSFITRRLDA